MRKRPQILKVLAGIGVIGGAAALGLVSTRSVVERPAHAVGDLPPAGANEVPNVLIYMDTSASQNANLGKQTTPSPALANGTYVGQVYRYMTFQSVLTGQLRHPTLPGQPAVGDPTMGLLDKYVDKMYFGFAGSDYKTADGADGAGGFSYGWTTTGPQWSVDYPESADIVQHIAEGVFQDGSTTVPTNAGFQNDDPAADFPFVKIYSDTPANTNARIQLEALGTAFGGTTRAGFMDAFADALYYFTEDEDFDSGNVCGDKFFIYMVSDTPANKEMQNALEMIRRLDAEGVQLYVVAQTNAGSPEEPSVIQYANMLAEYAHSLGKSKCAYDPDVYGPATINCAFIARGGKCSSRGLPVTCDVSGAEDLSQKLGTVMQIILNQVTSRTRVATASAPLLSASTYQWRVGASFQVRQVGGAWRGFLRGAQYDESGEVTRELAFDQLLNTRTAPRQIYTVQQTTSGWVTLPLSYALQSFYSGYVSSAYSYHSLAGRWCTAMTFFSSASTWYSRLSGDPPQQPMASSCLSAPAEEQAMVQSYLGHRLGDIYHSSPITVGPPDKYINDPGYIQFMLDNRDRPTMVYVGANDGMLHAFVLRHGTYTALEGQEAWAYMPAAVIPNIHKRVETHEYFVDGTFKAKDVQLESTATTTGAWATMLVGCLGRGGGTCFAIDVTDPASPNFRWELTRPQVTTPSTSADPGLTYVNGSVGIGRVFTMETASTGLPSTGGTPRERPVAIIPGGYNPSDLSLGRSLYIVDLWSGALIRRFPDPALDGTALAALMDAPFTGTPTAYMDQPGTLTTRVFVGDLKGRMWRVDLSSPDPSQWRMTRFFPAETDATYNSAVYQKPIYLAPTVALDYGRRPIVYYGTGNIQDLDVVEPNYLFAVRENVEMVGNQAVVTGQLIPTSEGGHWPIVFADNEKLTGDPVIFNGVLLLTTFTQTTGVCGFGEGKLYGLDFITGDGRITEDGRLTYAGDEAAVNSMSLGAGVPSAPIIQQQPVTLTTDAYGNPVASGGGFTALIQRGAQSRTEDVTDTTFQVDLGEIEPRADILTVVEIE